MSQNKFHVFVVLFTITIFLLIIFNNDFIIAQNVEGKSEDKRTPDVPDIPKVPGTNLLGEIDEEEGLPKSLVELRELADQYRNREQNKSFLAREWTGLLAKNKFFGPILFYTDKFFSFFNPIWDIMFGLEFSWSWGFFLGLLLWLSIIIMVYFPGKAMLNNKLFGIVLGVIVATITGIFGVIKIALLFFTPFIKNIWHLGALIIIGILLVTIYEKIFANLQKESEEEELKRSKESIKSLGKVSGEGLEELGKK